MSDMRISQERIESNKRIAAVRSAIAEALSDMDYDEDLTYLEIVTAYNEVLTGWLNRALKAETAGVEDA